MAWSFLGRGPAPAAARPEPAGASAVCLVCGGAIHRSGPAACTLCGAPCAAADPSAERCPGGHAVCGACLSGPPADLVERICGASDEQDPVALALRLVSHPRLRLAPEDYDLVVPAALVAAWSSRRGEAAARGGRVREARARLAPVPPEVRARRGGEGASAGAGIFVAVASSASRQAGGGALVDRVVARARAVIGEGDDALCERRNTLVAVLAAARFAREELGADLPSRGLACERAGKNPTCVGSGCPFNR